jgi:hypothetical protein
MLKVGDKVKLNGCPFDDQIAEELLRYIEVKDQIQIVTKVKKTTEYGTSGQWVKTNLMDDWCDKAWFDKI